MSHDTGNFVPVKQILRPYQQLWWEKGVVPYTSWGGGGGGGGDGGLSLSLVVQLDISTLENQTN
mgnify:FL=1